MGYLDSLVLSLNHASFDDYHRALAYFERYPGRKVVLWSESPAVEAFVEEMAAAGLHTGDPGQGSRLLARHRLRARRGARRLHRLPGRGRRQLQPRDARAARAARGRADRRLRLRQGLLRARLRPAPRPRDPPPAHPAARRVHPPHRAGPLHPLPLVLPLRALRRVRDQVGPRRAHAPALRLGARDRHALRGAAPPRRRPHLPGRDRRALRPQAPGPLRRRPLARPQPHGARRGEAPAAHARRGRGDPRPGPADEPAGRLPARGRGRGRRQPRGGEHQRPRLRPARGGAHRPGLHPGAARRDRGVPRRPARPAPRPQLVPGLGGRPRRERAARWPRWRRATRRCGGSGDETGRASSRPTSTGPSSTGRRTTSRPPAPRSTRCGSGACRSSW